MAKAAALPPPPAQLALFDAVGAAAAAPLPPAAGASAPPAILRHPQARGEVLLEGHAVAYALRRTRRRSIGFVVGAEGLAVSAPRWVGVAEIEAALQSKAGWVLRKLHEQGERQRRLQAQRIEWCDGATLPFLGAPLVVRLDPAVTGALLDALLDSGEAADAARAAGARGLLRLGLPAHAGAAQVRDLAHGWLQRQARRVFDERIRHFEPLLRVRVRRWALSTATTRWGSASADGSVRLHWRLIHLPPASIDYVVAHELAHLREMHHGPAFWDLVRTVIPDVEQRRRALREHTLAVDD